MKLKYNYDPRVDDEDYIMNLAHHASDGDDWTDEDEAAFEEWEEQRQKRLFDQQED